MPQTDIAVSDFIFIRDRPKSARRTYPSASIRIFSGFRLHYDKDILLSIDDIFGVEILESKDNLNDIEFSSENIHGFTPPLIIFFVLIKS